MTIDPTDVRPPKGPHPDFPGLEPLIWPWQQAELDAAELAHEAASAPADG